VDSGLTNSFVYSLATSGSSIFAGTDGHVYRSTNSGANWTEADSGLTRPGYAFYVWCLAVSGTSIFAGTSGGVFRSTDNGMSWTQLEIGPLYTGFWTFLVSGTSLYAGTLEPEQEAGRGGIFLSTNNGSSWSEEDSGIMPTNVFALALAGADILAGTSDYGVLLSTDKGTSWRGVNSGLANGVVWSLAVSGTNLLAAIGSWGAGGAGVWRRPLSELLSVDAPAIGAPAVFGLEQNYPNPFNPSTTIRYALPHRTHVLLTVLNTLGQRVATLVDAVQEPGEHSVKFDGGGIASGVYYYRLQTGGYVRTMRMLVLH